MLERLRELKAIMFTDVVGFTRLMAEDSDKTIGLMEKNVEIQKHLVEKYNGTWVKEIGDGTMVSFSSALDAVRCALDIQQSALTGLDAKLRIGIHLDDITIKGDDVYGEGVNIAARLESIADPGGIYISESIEKAIRGNSDINSRYLGELYLKNVDYMVRTYTLQGEGLPVPQKDHKKELEGQFLAEIKRRGILRTGIVYLLISLLVVLAVTRTGLSQLIPQWVVSVLIGFLFLFFPLSIWLSWKFEWSPGGLVKTTSDLAWRNPYDRSMRKPLTGNVIIAILVLMNVVLASYSIYRNTENTGSAVRDLEKSIAVLPFKSMGDEDSENAFSDGQWEAILSRLSKIRELRVISGQSTEQYRNSSKTAGEIAEELRVSYLLQGSVQKHNDQAKITVQLIDGDKDEHIWSQEFTRKITDIFSLQSDIAYEVASELEVRLNRREQGNLDSYQLDPDLYEYYLGTDYMLDEFITTGDTSILIRAISQLRNIIREAPEFSQAYVDLAKSLIWMENNVVYPDSSLLLIEKAITINPENADAHMWHAIYNWNYSDTDQELVINTLERVLELDPHHSAALSYLGRIHLFNKNFREGLDFLFRSIRNNPNLQSSEFQQRVDYYNTISELLMYMGLYEKSLEFEKKLMKIDPDYLLRGMGFILTLTGDFNEALRYYKKVYKEEETNRLLNASRLAEAYSFIKEWDEAEKYFRICMELIADKGDNHFQNSPSFLFRFGYVLWQQGKKEEANQMFNRHIEIVQDLVDNGSNYPGHLYDLACTYSFTGKEEQALILLDKIPFWYVTYGLIRIDPMMDPLRDNPEFQRIIQQQKDEMLELRHMANMEKYKDDLQWVLNK